MGRQKCIGRLYMVKMRIKRRAVWVRFHTAVLWGHQYEQEALYPLAAEFFRNVLYGNTVV